MYDCVGLCVKLLVNDVVMGVFSCWLVWMMMCFVWFVWFGMGRFVVGCGCLSVVYVWCW